MEITTGKQEEPMRAVFYGPEGVGKSSLAALCPKPLFIDTEGSTRRMSVARTPKPTGWAHLLELVGELARDPQGYQTLVVDTTDWAERLCAAELCAAHGKSGIEGFGYGKGWVYLAEAFGGLLTALDALAARTGMNIVLTAHATVRRMEQPEDLGSYDKWCMKLSRQVEPLVKEWADMLLFLAHKTTVVTDDDGRHGKACDSKRVIYTEHAPTHDAKNRDGLPREVSFASPGAGYAAIEGCFRAAEGAPASAASSPAPGPPQGDHRAAESEAKGKLRALMAQAGIQWEDLLARCVERGHLASGTKLEHVDDDYINRGLIANWQKIIGLMEEPTHV